MKGGHPKGVPEHSPGLAALFAANPGLFYLIPSGYFRSIFPSACAAHKRMKFSLHLDPIEVGIGYEVAIAIAVVSVLFDTDPDCDSDTDPDGSLFAVIFGTGNLSAA